MMERTAAEYFTARIGEYDSLIRRCVPRYDEMLDLPDLRCDLVVSSISLHHVRDKGTLYRRLHALLDPGGAFWFSDQLHGGTDRIHEIHRRRWLDFCREPGRCTNSEIQSLLDHAAEHDHYTPLEEHFRLLGEAGFRDLDCTWRNWIWGIVGAEKQEEAPPSVAPRRSP